MPAQSLDPLHHRWACHWFVRSASRLLGGNLVTSSVFSKRSRTHACLTGSLAARPAASESARIVIDKALRTHLHKEL